MHRVEVGFKEGIRDALGVSVRKRIEEDLKIKSGSVNTIDVYTIDADLDNEQLKNVAENLFADPVIQKYKCNEMLANNFSWVIEVSFRAGVTDNAGKTAKEAIEDILNKKINSVYTSKQYLIRNNLRREEVERIAKELLANELIERWIITKKGDKINVEAPVVSFSESKVEEIELKGDLKKLSDERLLSLNSEEMEAIKNYVDSKIEERKKVGLEKITDVELESIAQTWSEHCKHKIFNALIDYEEDGKKEVIDSLFNAYIKKSTNDINKDFLVSVFKDNAGIIRFNDSWNIAMKVETHNAPSALDPYGGALTGIVGVNRDIIGAGVGAKPICNTDVFCFASPYYSQKLPPKVLHPKRIFEGVRKGVEHGGNKSGIPTVNGSIVFDDRFLGRPLVYCGTLGIMP